MTDDPIKTQWACLSCFAKFPAGKLRLSGGLGEPSPGNVNGLNCPRCRSRNVHPADGKSYQQGEMTDRSDT